MTKSEIVEALRCAADLCDEDEFPLWRVSRESIYIDAIYRHVWRVLGGPPRGAADDKRHDLLEAAQRIEEGQ